MRVVVILLSIISCQNSSETHFTTPSSETLDEVNGFESFGYGVEVGKINGRSRVVETKYGRVQGLSLTLFPHLQNQNHPSQGKNTNTSNHNPLKNKIVEIFLGIPYASPPIRFSPTQTPIPWSGVKATDKPNFVCPQILPDLRDDGRALKEMPKGFLEYLRSVEPYLRNQSEDCLYLNIFSPSGPEPRLKPVLIFVHGGKFSWGSGNLYDGTVLAAYGDVLFVAINYRLGVLGFLNLNPSPLTKPRVANYGLMDQIAALHWIKENIMFFGGDPQNITLMGYEAGAACIHFLMSSPAVTPGLFHRAVLMAGSSHAPWALVADPAAMANGLAEAVNCSHLNTSLNASSSLPNATASGSGSGYGSSASGHGGHAPITTVPAQSQSIRDKSYGLHSQDPVMDCLKTKNFAHFSAVLVPHKFATDFGPTVDGVVIKPHFRMNVDSAMGKRDLSKKYDILVGLSSLEKMTEFSEVDLTFGFEAQRRDAIVRTLVRNSYRFHLNEIVATITNEYTDWERSVQHPIATRDLTLNAVTDCLSLAPVIAAAESSLVNKAYFYVFDHATKDGLYNYQRSGAAGGEELSYMMGFPLTEPVTGHILSFFPPHLPSNFTRGEMAVSELLITYISNFVHTGDPNEPAKQDVSWAISKERNRFRTNPWESYDRVHQKYLEISGSKIRTRSHYRAHQMAIWLRLVPELQKSGAHYASSLHNRMKGGNDPSLYVGSVRNVGDEDANQQIFDIGFDESPSLDTENNGSGVNRNPPSPPTTCFSPVFSAKNSSSSSPPTPQTNKQDGRNDTTFEVANIFSPYSTALSVTIAVGCSLLILNVFIFALVYYQRDKRRAQLLKESQSTESNQKYGEPPELLKSNSNASTMTTTGALIHKSNSIGSQSQSIHLDMCSLHGPSSHHHQQQQHQQQQQQMPHHHRGILLSPQQTQAHAHANHHHYSPQVLGVATLPRSNGGLAIGTMLPKPPPPPRSVSNFSTLPHKQQQQQGGNNSAGRLTPFEEMNL